MELINFDDFLYESQSSKFGNKSGKSRSGRLLSDEQEYSNNDVVKSDENIPSMLFTDVVGSSKFWSDDPITMKAQLEQHFKSVDEIARKHDGFIIKTIGDAFMIYFRKSTKSLESAISCGKEIIKTEKLPLRLGICEGFMEQKKYILQNAELLDFFGNTVNTASRMESRISKPGHIAFTSTQGVDPKLLKTIGNYKELTGKELPDLNGVKVKSAYLIKVK